MSHLNDDTFDTDHYEAFTTKAAILVAVRDFAEQGAPNLHELLKRIAITNLAGVTGAATVTEAYLNTALAAP